MNKNVKFSRSRLRRSRFSILSPTLVQENTCYCGMRTSRCFFCVDRDLAEVFVIADSYQSVIQQADRSYSLHTVEDRVHCNNMLSFSYTVSTGNDS